MSDLLDQDIKYLDPVHLGSYNRFMQELDLAVRSGRGFYEKMDQVAAFLRQDGVLDTFSLYERRGGSTIFQYTENAKEILIGNVPSEESSINQSIEHDGVVVIDVRDPENPKVCRHPTQEREEPTVYDPKPARQAGKQLSYVSSCPFVLDGEGIGGMQFLTNKEPDVALLSLFHHISRAIQPYSHQFSTERYNAILAEVGDQFVHDVKNRISAAYSYVFIIDRIIQGIGPIASPLYQKLLEYWNDLSKNIKDLNEMTVGYFRGLNIGKYSFSDLVREIARWVEQMDSLNNIGIEMDIGGIQELDPIYFDRTLVKERLLNIPHNLLPRLKQGHRAYLAFRTYEIDGYHVLEIEDRAGGIPAEIKGDFLNRRVTTKQGERHGVGMISLKTALEKHGGFIKYEDVVEGVSVVGTKFVIGLPVSTDFEKAA